MSEPPIVAVVGATASGKSDLALDLAERLGGEVVNTDAMAIYRGMDIGTAKLPPDQRRGLPHHLLDLLEVHEEASVAVFQRLAREVVDDVRARGRVPVLVGGSALYTRAVVDRLDFPGTDPAVRGRLEAELAEQGAGVLHARLREADPVAAAAIEPGNGRRIVRALEVVELTGSFRATLPEPVYLHPETVQIGVDIDRPTLDARIERRVEQMWQAGLVEEVRGLVAPSRTASRALGYAQVLEHLAGQTSEEEAKRRTVVGTRRFARRQDAWFRKDPRVHWVRHDDPDRLGRALHLL
ncbi:tRNA (adenosine(37)-N6)-dimethylallyltransferase MiaA [Nocardioides mangrovicus]|uniref:tRNA (adenosine(37)-N6)-dimethylallyltransferase MiaA n=1 Tax=Nocardioides mangrovicus TaxID=2478913 RepID=UPI001E62DF0C|nr:tRNA (adenosine(37)-N6)-dimethylallyltransferase MiaA [Nocardioides mangrovicus]